MTLALRMTPPQLLWDKATVTGVYSGVEEGAMISLFYDVVLS